jgi:hypothetical protein
MCSLFVCAGGCAVAALIDKTSDPKDPAKYVPDHDDLAILVEDYQNPALIENMADHMDHLICEELVANKVAPVVNPAKLTLLRLDHPDEYKKMKIPTIGMQLGARQVLYVNITQYSVTAAGGTEVITGHAEALVKVVDCVSGDTRWPRDATSAGYPVSVDIPFSASVKDVNSASVNEGLARALSAKVARLFYNANMDQPDYAPAYPESDLH